MTLFRTSAAHILIVLMIASAALLLVPRDAEAAAEFIQSTNSGATSCDAGTTVSTSAINTETGNAFLVAVTWDDATVDPSPTISDSKGNIYTQVAAAQTDNNGQSLQLFYVTNGLGGTSHTFTATFSPAVQCMGMIVHEVAGIKRSNALDQATFSVNDLGADVSVGPVTTTADREYIFAVLMNTQSVGGSISSVAPFTERSEPTIEGIPFQTQDYIQPSRGAITSSWTTNASAGTVAQMATFIAAPAGLGKPPNNLGLVGYWSFNDATSTQATDFSGNGNHGTLNTFADPPTSSSGWTLGKRGKALQFEGASDNVSTSRSQSMTADVTMAAWVKLDNLNTEFVVVAQDVQGAGIEIVQDGGTAGEINFYTGDGADNFNETGAYTSSLPGLSAGVWYHIVGVFNDAANTATIYLNGAVYDSDTATNSHNTAATTFHIGRNGDWVGAAQFMDGAIDEVRIYNRALGATEVAALYGGGSNPGAGGAVQIGASTQTLQQGTTLGDGLIGFWTFDGYDMRGATAYDRSGSGNDGTLTLATPVSGKLGQALNFSNNDSNPDAYVAMGDPSTFDGLTRITVSAWAKSRASGANASTESHIVDKSDCTGGAGDGPFELMNASFLGQGSRALFVVYPSGGTGENSGFGTTNIDDGEWHFWTGVYDGTNVSIWVDGVEENSANIGSVTLSTSAGWLVVGGECNSQFFSWDGHIDDVRIYNRALTTAEIQQLYRLGGTTLRP